MKKSLIALAVMAAAGAASAQSSVTLFGIVDANISYQRTSGGEKNTFLANSGYNSSRLGFRGTEDLGGGLSASFWLEGALANDVGFGGSQATGFDFRRRSTVSLAGGWGEVRLGRDYVPTFWNMTVFDPFGTNGVGSNIGHKVKLDGGTAATAGGIVDPAYVRSNNMVQYFLPANLGGFYGQISYAFDETPNTAAGQQNAGRYIGGRLGFASGPFNVAAAYGQTDGQETFASPDVKNWNIGGQWDFGMAKLLGVYDRASYESVGVDNDLDTWLIGGLIPVGAGEIRLSYGRSKLDTAGGDPRTSQWALGYVHNLSKRTALYATYAHVSNKDGANISVGSSLQNRVAGLTNASSSGFDLGIRHSF
ncbi:porin [Ramlibacter sp. USB13]|uniref:Porin n=1 Tax=Ramlibacter cellulosilyticus TaxID=2764187 RepID=A0A923SGL9_9BURK|nr:porin [Ramlibacter cellulosilyticus]MBC5785052.1 porin [Ramlibacter cellulosilyticus]